MIFTSVDGYESAFKKAEVRNGLIMVAIKGNGVPFRCRISTLPA